MFTFSSNQEDEIQDRFHEDREKNLKSFFRDSTENFNDPVPVSEDKDDFSRAIRNKIVSGDHEESDEEDYEENEESFRFPSRFTSRENPSSHTKGYEFHEPHWDDFFTGLSDNIDKNINDMARHSDDHTRYSEEGEVEEDEEETPERNDHAHEYNEVSMILASAMCL